MPTRVTYGCRRPRSSRYWRRSAGRSPCSPAGASAAGPGEAGASGSLPGVDLARDGRVFDRGVVGEHEGLAQDHRHGAVALEGQIDVAGLAGEAGTLRRYDAQVLVVRLHLDVAAAQVDPVGAQIAAHDEEAVLERAAR